MISKAFAPGHISGFFEPVYHPNDFLRTGSRGAGLSISAGSLSELTVIDSNLQKIEVYINGKRSPAPVTKLALKYMIGNNKLNIVVRTKLDLHMGQGFGMSGAGALSSCLALAKTCGLSNSDAMRASHFAEVNLKTGLGDVISSFVGGFEIRRTPGLPPWGIIEHIPGNYNVVLCVIGSKINTKKILTDKNSLNKIVEYGRFCTKKILEKPSIENFFYLSDLFSRKTNLATKKIIEAMDSCKNYGKASMCMLGNSVFAIGKTDELSKILSQFGKVYVCNVDQNGAKII